ncbi:MAG: outer rane lipoprotein LolB [Verrucomicrobiaceae bacterium]|nr:outer rane lipoprotein LolB [Verrucomicrobiaceae bacterium]
MKTARTIGQRLLTLSMAILLAACGTTGIRPGTDDHERWQLSGKIGLRGPQLAESAYINWRQCGNNYDVRISGPLGQTVARIDGSGEQLSIWFEGKEPVVSADPEALMQQQLGWSVPLRALRYWVRAEAVPGSPAQMSGPAHQPESLQQLGWQVAYLGYHQNGATILPAKLRVSGQQDLQATLIINEWLLSDAVTGCP